MSVTCHVQEGNTYYCYVMYYHITQIPYYQYEIYNEIFDNK